MLKKNIIFSLLLALSLCMIACSGSQNKTITCTNCSSKIAADSKFCSTCGASVMNNDANDYVNNTTTDETTGNENTEDSFDPYDYAFVVCQSIKDSLTNPDSIQIHKVYYIKAYWHNYYIDFSAMNQLGGYTRESYEVLFNEDSSLYSIDKAYDLPDIFEKYEYMELDTNIIESKLE